MSEEPRSRPEWFINRELSWLAFNRRVLEEAQDPRNPLLERVKFLAIFDSNLVEFYEVRVAGLRQQAEAGIATRGPDGMTAADQLDVIEPAVRELVAEFYTCWNEALRPALEKEGIVVTKPEQLGAEQQRWLREHFQREIFPVLTPIAVDPAHPFPFVGSGNLNIAALLDADDPEEPSRLAVVQVPRVLPRVFRVPTEGRGRTYVFLADTIRWQLPELFAGATILDHTAFRVVRNSNLYVDEEEVENLLTAIEQELRKRRRGDPVRLELRAPVGERLRQELLEVFELEAGDVHDCEGPVNLSRLMQLVELEKEERLLAPPFISPTHVALRDPAKLFPSIRSGDLLLHHPFDSFDSVVEFIEQAAEDPRVLAIKQTLYRTSEDSSIARALLAAAERGKHVTAVVELKARFDEEKNIRWARRMEEAGVQIVYGLVGLKTHCKLLLVVRREEDGIRRYAHIGTGNYNPATARQYTDFGLFTADPEVTAEVASVFNLLTSLSSRERWNHLLVAPFTLRSGLLERIRREAAHARAGRPASIFGKLNAIQDQEVILALYDASRAGVEIDLIVRGICCLRPGVPGLSENIRVRSIVDRFLEHTRVVRFENDGQPELWIGSADWMPRNLSGRVEVLCRVRAPAVIQRLEEVLDVYRRDDVKARELMPDGQYRLGDGTRGVRAQEWLIQRANQSLPV
ncbi:polyphosphate kinase 1 [Myxococcota bacterium]|nr:polyphosphate kinase 1 [Myxococcota bacterium]MCZ7619719.1 polyphosphate kinase 1 [Myxococcota bacterium]